MIDLKHLDEMIQAAKDGNNISEWSSITAEGRNQLERIGTIYTQLLVKAQRLAIESGKSAKYVIASPSVIALLERLGDFVLVSMKPDFNFDNNPVHEVGKIRNGALTTYRDITRRVERPDYDPYNDYDVDYILITSHLGDVKDPKDYQYIRVEGLTGARKRPCEVCGEVAILKGIDPNKGSCFCYSNKPVLPHVYMCARCVKAIGTPNHPNDPSHQIENRV